jgi:MOSC domain-containing protein YiiM
MARIVSVNISEKKGMRKKSVSSANIKKDFGIEDDGHAGKWHRQVSLLAVESIKKMTEKGLDVGPGDFAENLTTEGIELFTLPIGTKIIVGDLVEMEVTQIGKICHDRCAIYYQAGDCVMPKEGIFVKVLKGGEIRPGDAISVVNANEILTGTEV